MVFKPGQSGNPLGRARHIDPRSKALEEFCKKHRDNIEKVGEIVIRRAVKTEEPWALKLCLEHFYPKPGTFISITSEENTAINLNLVNSLSFEEKQTFLKLWLKNKRGTKVFNVEKPALDVTCEDITDLDETTSETELSTRRAYECE